jgi:hypothetical protein
VQFSTVEQALRTNSQLEKLTGLLETDSMTSALDFIGLDVGFEAEQLRLAETGNAGFTYQLARPAAEARITIRDARGAIVREAQADPGAGAHAFAWDGKGADGRRLPAGLYRIEVAPRTTRARPWTRVPHERPGRGRRDRFGRPSPPGRRGAGTARPSSRRRPAGGVSRLTATKSGEAHDEPVRVALLGRVWPFRPEPGDGDDLRQRREREHHGLQGVDRAVLEPRHRSGADAQLQHRRRAGHHHPSRRQPGPDPGYQLTDRRAISVPASSSSTPGARGAASRSTPAPEPSPPISWATFARRRATTCKAGPSTRTAR